jgi:hypothetical protein
VSDVAIYILGMKTTNRAHWIQTETEHNQNEIVRRAVDSYHVALSAVRLYPDRNPGKDAPESAWRRLFAAEDRMKALGL